MQLVAGDLRISVDLVVLDKDGTMFELDGTWARLAVEWEDRLEATTGIAGLAEAIGRRIGHERSSGTVSFGGVLAAGTMQELRDSIVELIESHGGNGGVVDNIVQPEAGALTPKGDLSGWMSRVVELGCRIAVLTSDDRHATVAHLSDAGVDHLVVDLVAGDDEVPPKPDPAGLLALCRSCEVDPSDTVMIGDSPGDMEAAVRAGTYRIGVRSLSGETPSGAQAVVGALDEIAVAP